jgi:PGF-pre-PGF domain-containing protein/uncharacterized repeat protein (TIGR01451 family)
MGAELMKMKADFLNIIITLLLILLIVPGIVPGIASALDGPLEDDGNSTVDLTMELNADSKVAEPGSSVSVYAVVTNEGNAASDPTNIIFTRDGESIQQPLGVIEPDSKVTAYYKWTAPEQAGTVTVTAYLEGAEASQKKISITVQTPLPDLTIESVVPEPANPQEGQPLNFAVRVKNLGTVPSGAALATFFINNVRGQDLNIKSLAAGESTDLTFSLTPDQVIAGKMTVRVVADSGKTVDESNENNNERTRTLNLNGLPPDLTIETFSLSPETPKVGDTITFTATIKNNGTGASPASKLKYNIIGTSQTNSGVVLPSDTLDIDSIAAGGAKQITFIWAPTNEGNIEVTALVDPDAVISESDETNNQNIITATITKESTSGGGGSSSGSGGSSSGSSGSSSGSSSSGSIYSMEPAKNVASKELATRNVISGSHIRYDFSQNSTCVMFIEYDALRTFQRTTTTIEELNNRSTFVPERPSGVIYKYMNIWVGDKLGGLPESIANGLIGFRVEKSWINDNNVNESLVTLQWYNKSWEPLYTKKVGEDDNYSYFNSTVPGYSFFAITEYTEKTDKDGTQIGAKLQDTFLGGLESKGKEALNNSGNNSKAQEARGAAKIVMAVTLPLFLLFVAYLVFKKRI